MKHEKWCDTTLSNHRSKFKVNISKKELLKVAKETLYCNLCGCHLKWNYEDGRNGDSPTLDRIDNEKVLTLDNTWIVCFKCNRTKGKMPLPEFVAYCELIYKRYNELWS